MSRTRKISGWLGAALCALLNVAGAPRASAQAQNEYVLRAAYVFNLAKYVEWPPERKSMTVCLVGEGPMAEALSKMLAGKTIGERAISVNLHPSDEALAGCDVVYVERSSAQRTHEVLEHLRGQSSLTIGETKSFAHEGGGIGLVRAGDQIQIEINVGNVEATGLKISSRLLNLSSVVCVDRKN